MRKNYKISVCLPTHNRAVYLKKGLEAFSNLERIETAEIVIADDASTDETDRVVEEFKVAHPYLRIVYKKFSSRQYFDKIVLRLVEMASGDYCWLISDDDIPEKDTLVEIEKILRKHSRISLLHMNYSRFDKSLNKKTADKMVGSIKKDIYFDSASKFFFKPIKDSYFSFLGTNVITMSTNIVDRQRWLAAAKRLKKFIGHNFIHCFVIGTMIKKDPEIYYIAKPQVQYLANNHRLWPNDVWKDYNNVLLGYLVKIGYPKVRILEMQDSQRKYERREAVVKGKFSQLLYRLLQPLYSRLILLKEDVRK